MPARDRIACRWLPPLLLVVARSHAEDAVATLEALPAVTVRAERPDAPVLSPAGVAQYSLDASDILDLPSGTQTSLTDVLAQMPGVAIDQNQQIHIRNTEGPQFQYRINGFLVPLDINTNPPFLSMLNSLFIDRLDLQVGALPARYGFATGGVVDIQSKDGCRSPGGEFDLYAGQRATVSPSVQYAACDGAASSYVSARVTSSDTAFSSATPGPTPLHDTGRSQQALGFWTYALADQTHLSLLLSADNSDNQLPNVPGLAPAYALSGVANPPSSAGIDSQLNFRDYLLMGTVKTSPTPSLDLQMGYTAHFISQEFFPDPVAELIYQGVASQATHEDRDDTLEGDLSYVSGQHTVSAGFYAGVYGVKNSDLSLVFPVTGVGGQASDAPLRVPTGSSANNVISSLYVGDLWRFLPHWSLDFGLRGDDLTGYTRARQLSPRLNLALRPTELTALHLGVARFLQVPSLLGIAPTTQAAFAATTAEGPPGIALPLAEADTLYDAGVAITPLERFTVSLDSYYERTHHYLDTGQFGVVPIFAPFNYDQGHMWGADLGARYRLAGGTA